MGFLVHVISAIDFYIDPENGNCVLYRGFGTGQDKAMTNFSIRSHISKKCGYMFLLNWYWGYPGLSGWEL